MQYLNKNVCLAKYSQTTSFHKTNLSLFYFFVLFNLLVSCQTVNAGNYEVSPMMIEFESAPKLNEKFQFHIKGLTAGKVRIYTAGLKQQLTGHMGFIDEQKHFSDGLAGWLSLDKTHFEVKKDQVITVNGQFKVPVDASGGYLAAIMVERR